MPHATAAPARARRNTSLDILDAAEAVFIERGWRAAGMRDVAGRAGLAPSSLYNHYGSKRALFASVITRRARQLEEEAVRGFLHLRRFPENLEGVVTLVRRLARDHPQFLRLAMIDLVEFGAANITSLELDVVPVIEALFRPHFERDVARAKLRDFDLTTVVRFTYLSLFLYFGLSGLYGGGHPTGVETDSEDHEIARLLELGILARPDTGPAGMQTSGNVLDRVSTKEETA